MSNLTPEQLIAKWPIGKVIELSAESRQAVQGLLKAPIALSDFFEVFGKKTGQDSRRKDARIPIESEEEIAKARAALEETKVEMGRDVVSLIESVFYGGEEMTIESLRGLANHMNVRVITDSLYKVTWGLVRVELMRTYNMDRKEWSQLSLSINHDQIGVIRVNGYNIVEEEEQADARNEG